MKKRPLRIMEMIDATGMGVGALGDDKADPASVFKGIAIPVLVDDVEDEDVLVDVEVAGVELGENKLDVVFSLDSTPLVWMTREVCTVVAVKVLVTWWVIT